MLIPVLALLAAVPVDRLLAEASRGELPPRPSLLLPAALVLACVAVRAGTLRNGAYPNEVRKWATQVDNNVRAMAWLDTVRRDGATMVVGDIGAAGFFGNLRVIDVYGVVDPKVAHKRVDGFGTGKAGHEKTASVAELLASKPTYIKWGYIDPRDVPRDYYLFNDFPPSLRVEGLWVRDDYPGRALPETAFHLDARELRRWTRTGKAFARAGSERGTRKQREVWGRSGGFVNSFTSELGDRATGRLLSPEFLVQGDRMRLLVGGGRDPERLRVSLIVDGRVVHSATGTSHETLGRREWDLSPFSGKTARIEIVDEAEGSFGHILVDELVQWTGPRPAKL